MSIKIKDLSFSYGTRRCAGAGRGQGPYDVKAMNISRIVRAQV